MTRLKGNRIHHPAQRIRARNAYYWGVYVNAASYNFKIGKEGKRGNAYGAGISVGYTAPLYGYRNNYPDLGLGGSADCFTPHAMFIRTMRKATVPA